MTVQQPIEPDGTREAPAKSILESGPLEDMCEELEAWRNLPFTRVNGEEIVDYWAPPEITGVAECDAYAAQCYLGALYAFEALDLVETFKSRIDDVGALSPIARAMVKRGQWTGFEIGFFAAMDGYILDGQIKVAGGVLAWPEEDPAEAAPTAGRTEIERLYEQALGFYEQVKKAADRGDGHAADRIHESFDKVRDKIMETPATCPQDVAIKLRLFANIMDIVDRPETLPEMSDNAAEGYLRTAICDLERPGLEWLRESDALLEKLAVDFQAACNASDLQQDVLDDARLKAARPDAKVVLAESGETAIQELMLQIPAAGLQGVRAKIKAMMTPFAWKSIREADSPDFDPCRLDTGMFHSVVMDLERLAGGNAIERPARSERAKKGSRTRRANKAKPKRKTT